MKNQNKTLSAVRRSAGMIAPTSSTLVIATFTLTNNNPQPTKTMNALKKYNSAEMAIMQTVRDRLKWYLGEELGFDPETTPDSAIELEMRFAKWITTGGGAWLRSIPEIHAVYEEI